MGSDEVKAQERMSDERWDAVLGNVEYERHRLSNEIESLDDPEAQAVVAEVHDDLAALAEEAERARESEAVLLARERRRLEMDAALVERLDVLRKRLEGKS
jgi:hypothetical protein